MHTECTAQLGAGLRSQYRPAWGWQKSFRYTEKQLLQRTAVSTTHEIKGGTDCSQYTTMKIQFCQKGFPEGTRQLLSAGR
jgi:hypothetical protein